MNNSLRITLCNGRDLITQTLCKWDRKLYPLEFFYAMATPINYAGKRDFPSVVSWRAVEYMKFM